MNIPGSMNFWIGIQKRKWAPLIVLATLLLTFAGCGDGAGGDARTANGTAIGDSRPVTASLSVSVGLSSGFTTLAAKGTADQVQAVSVEVRDGAGQIASEPLEKNAAGQWFVTIHGLPVGPLLTFIGHAYNSEVLTATTEIFRGQTDMTLSGLGDSLTLALKSLDDGTGNPLPTIAAIIIPETIGISTTVTVEVQVAGEKGTSLTFAFGSGGGGFSPETDSVSLDAILGTGVFTAAYTAPDTAASYAHTLKLSNVQGNSVETAFSTAVGLTRCILDLSKLDNCALGP